MIDHLTFAQEARRDFIKAGPEGHFACSPGHATGWDEDDRLCVLTRAGDTEERLDADVSFLKLQLAWRSANGEEAVETNARGFEACVAAYDRLVLALAAKYAPTLTRDQVLV